MRWFTLLSALILSSCLRSAGGSPAPPLEDTSIVFPMFFGVKATTLGEEGALYQMDGVVLRALMVATQDFLRSDGPGKPCWSTPEGHRYGIIRRGDIIFIEIEADLDNCWKEAMPMDYSVAYAIGSDGRILRRLFSGHPDYPNPLRLSDAGVAELPQDRDYSDMLGYTGFSSHIAIPLSWLDGGRPHPRSPSVPSSSIPDGGPRPDGGVPSDAGPSAP